MILDSRLKEVSVLFNAPTSPYYSPFFAYYMNNFIFEKKDEGTAGVMIDKGRIYYYYNPAFMDKLPKEEIIGLVVHEIYHIITLTFTRKMIRKHKVWNIATDAINNDEISKTKFGGPVKVPSMGIFFDAYIDCPNQNELLERMLNSAEESEKRTIQEYIDIIKQNPYKGEKVAEPFYNYLMELGEKFTDSIAEMDDHSGLQDLDSISQERLEEILKDAVASGFGNISGDLIEKITSLTKSKVNWRQQLKNYVNKIIRSHNPVYCESSWRKINRKGLDIPGLRFNSTPVQFWIDSSGSLWDNENFKIFISELESLFSFSDELYLGIADTEVRYFDKYKKGDWKDLKIEGGGGTNFQPVFDFISQKKMTKTPVVFLTDGMFKHDIDYKKCQILWAMFKGKKPPPVGKSIFISE